MVLRSMELGPLDARTQGPLGVTAARARAVAFGIALLGSGACRPPDTSVRGFDSHQIVAVRDDTVRLASFALGNSSVYRARTIPDVAVPDGVTSPYDLSRFDLETGFETLIASAVLSTQKLPARSPMRSGDGRSLALVHFATDADVPSALVPSMLPPLFLTFLDEATNTAVEVVGVDAQNIQLGATRADPIVVGRLAPDRSTVWWFGAPETLMPLPSRINQLVGRDATGVIARTSSPDSNNTQRFARFPFDGSPAVTIVPGPLAGHIVVGADDVAVSTPAPIVPNGGVTPRLICPSVPSSTSTSTSSSAPSGSSDPSPPCLLFYDRLWPDMTVRGFARLLDDTPEFQLPGTLPGHIADVVQVAPDGLGALWPAVSSMKQTRVFAWSAGTDQAASCVVALSPGVATFRQNAWRPGTRQFVAIAQPSSQSKVAPGTWTAIAGTAGSECHEIATGDNLIKQIAYSPLGTRLAFLESDPMNMSKLYVAEADSPAPRLIAEGPSFSAIDFHDEEHLLLWRWSLDGYSVSWLDPASRSSPSIDHPIADGAVWEARASWAWLNADTVLVADSASSADGSCSLHVVDIATGETRLLSRGVVDFAVPWTKRPADATELLVAYVVRSRLPSAQDGVWSARIPLADSPP
jgi:hypothetical protein